MKKTAIILLVSISSYFVYGQESMQLNKQNAKEEYCMVSAFRKGLFSTKITVNIDFGQKVSFWRSTDYTHKLRDERGQAIAFNSVIDALNYMSSLGWEFVNAYAVVNGDSNVYHYIMKRVLTEADKMNNE